jgi:hypothetical protein
VTYALFGWIGFLISRRLKKPPAVAVWVTLTIAAILSGWVVPSAMLLGTPAFGIMVNWALQAIFLGILAGLIHKKIRTV